MTSNMIKIQALKKDNIDSWKIQMKAVLIRNDEWNYVNGKVKKPESTKENEKKIEEWESNDQKALSNLILAIDPSQLFQFKKCETSHELWKKLHSIYESTGPTRKAMLLKYLTLTRMKNEDDMREHLHKFFGTVDKLSEVEVLINEDLLCILLLNSLPESFNMFKCAIECRDELPSPEVPTQDKTIRRKRQQNEQEGRR